MANATNRVTFTIDDQNRIAKHDEGREPAPGLPRFTTQQEFEALAADWPSSRFLDVWNQIPGNIPVKKFTNRQTAMRRIWNRLENRERSAAALLVAKARKPKSQARPVSQTGATKSETVLALLRRPGRSHAQSAYVRNRMAGSQRPRLHQRAAHQETAAEGEIRQTGRRKGVLDPILTARSTEVQPAWGRLVTSGVPAFCSA
jgi:hypothetical protein